MVRGCEATEVLDDCELEYVYVDTGAGSVTVFAVSGSHAGRGMASVSAPLAEPTDIPSDIIGCALLCLTRIFRKGSDHRKAGVILSDLASGGTRQPTLFAAEDDGRKRMLADAMDRISRRFGTGSVKFAVEGLDKSWDARREMRNGSFTTNWKELPVAR